MSLLTNADVTSTLTVSYSMQHQLEEIVEISHAYLNILNLHALF